MMLKKGLRGQYYVHSHEFNAATTRSKKECLSMKKIRHTLTSLCRILKKLSLRSHEEIFTNVLKMERVAAKSVSKLLNIQEKFLQVIIPEPTNFVTDPEYVNTFQLMTKRIYGYEIETEAHSSQFRKCFERPKSKKIGQVLSNLKVLPTVFFYYNGIVYYNFFTRHSAIVIQ